MKHYLTLLCFLVVALCCTALLAQGLALTPWPVTRHDIGTTGRGVATVGALGVPDWTASIPGGGVTHGGISILPGGDLAWKSYNDGNVYRFDTVAKTIVWDSTTTAGIGTGTWAHGGVAVGNNGLYFGSRDGTYSVGALDYNGGVLWQKTLLDGTGATVQIRGTPVLNPTLNRLYVRDAGNDGILYALDAGNGNVLWQHDMRSVVDPVGDGIGNDAFYSSFGMFTAWGSGAEGDMYLYCNSNDADESILVRDDGVSASTVWFHDTANPGWNFSWHGSQAYEDGYIFASTFQDGGRPSAYKIDAATGTIVWQLGSAEGAANHFSRPAIGPDGTMYVGGHGDTLTAYADNGLTGAVRWQFAGVNAEINGYTSVTGTPGDTWIYTIDNGSMLYALHDDGVQTAPDLRWQYQLGPTGYFGSWQVTIDADGGLYVAGGDGAAEFGNFVLYHFPAIPEPGTMVMAFSGLAALFAVIKRRK